MKKLCIYHGNCADGFGAAWVVWKKFGPENVDFFPGSYQNPPPDVTDREIIMCDFSYPRTYIKHMLKTCKSMLILDHHKSASEDIMGADLADMDPDKKLTATFNMEKSGARMAWDYFFPDSPNPPDLILHIEDRDLWRFKLDNTRLIQANLFSYEYDFELWDMMMWRPAQNLVEGGRAIERKHFKDIKELLSVATRDMLIGGYKIPIANVPYTMGSDAGDILSKGSELFAGYYWDGPKVRNFGLRSQPNGVDVSLIAKQYGGGGHAHAAGFKVPFDVAQGFELLSDTVLEASPYKSHTGRGII